MIRIESILFKDVLDLTHAYLSQLFPLALALFCLFVLNTRVIPAWLLYLFICCTFCLECFPWIFVWPVLPRHHSSLTSNVTSTVWFPLPILSRTVPPTHPQSICRLVSCFISCGLFCCFKLCHLIVFLFTACLPLMNMSSMGVPKTMSGAKYTISQ